MPDTCTTVIGYEYASSSLATSTEQRQCFHPLEFQGILLIGVAIFCISVLMGWKAIKL